MADRKVCGTCGFAQGIGTTTGPSPSGPDDGVNCTCREIAEELNSLEEFLEYKSVNLFRLEVMDDEAECEHWKAIDPDKMKGGETV